MSRHKHGSRHQTKYAIGERARLTEPVQRGKHFCPGMGLEHVREPHDDASHQRVGFNSPFHSGTSGDSGYSEARGKTEILVNSLQELAQLYFHFRIIALRLEYVS